LKQLYVIVLALAESATTGQLYVVQVPPEGRIIQSQMVVGFWKTAADEV
jgi:hypothetical protein